MIHQSSDFFYSDLLLMVFPVDICWYTIVIKFIYYLIAKFTYHWGKKKGD